jgi:TonB family protein
MARSGTVTNVLISQPSGDYLLDTSSKRAVLDANPLPSLPPQYAGNDVTFTVWFQLQ